jgi:hypothetical protein
MAFKLGDKVKYSGPSNPRLDYFSDYTVSYVLLSQSKLYIALQEVGSDLKIDANHLTSSINYNIDKEKIRENFLKKLQDSRLNSLDEIRQNFPKDKPFDFVDFKKLKPK